jgi:broad specificity phosphatase PhoE
MLACGMPDTGPHRMFLVRHAQTEWSAGGRHTGRTDVPLLPEGRDDAAALSRGLAGTRFALVLSSPLQRAQASADLAGFGGQLVVDHDLSEWDYGAYEGRTTEEIRAERPGWSVWADGVVDGETVADVGRRADRVIERARSADGETLCFSHGHLLRVLAARWIGLPPVAGRVLALGPGSISVLGWEREVPVIDRWNAAVPGLPG